MTLDELDKLGQKIRLLGREAEKLPHEGLPESITSALWQFTFWSEHLANEIFFHVYAPKDEAEKDTDQ